MAMKKAEMQQHDQLYNERISEARTALRNGLYRTAIRAAFAACEHLDGMMRYGSKYKEREFASVTAIDIILKYAPLLLDLKSLEELDAFLTENKGIYKRTTDDIEWHLKKTAREQIWANHRLWSYIEQNAEVRQDELQRQLGGDQDYWRSVAMSWAEMGLVQRKQSGDSYLLTLSTRLGRPVQGKCPECGRVASAPKAMFLEHTNCPECGIKVLFVLLAESPNLQHSE